MAAEIDMAHVIYLLGRIRGGLVLARRGIAAALDDLETGDEEINPKSRERLDRLRSHCEQALAELGVIEAGLDAVGG
jgi:hypothetical protein